jgi:hypothetical protein
MKHKLEDLQNAAMRLIKDPAQTDPVVIAELAPIPARVQRMQMQWQQLEEETSRIEQRLSEIQRGGGTAPQRENGDGPVVAEHPAKGGRKKMRIVIDWSRLGKAGGKEIICEHLASASLARFVSRLYEVMGIETLDRLTKLRVPRGPFVSKNPRIDYWNPADHDTYQHQPVHRSGFFVLTHSETKQKVEDVAKVSQFLKLPLGAIVAETVDKLES